MNITHKKPFEEMTKTELIEYIGKLEAVNAIDVDSFIDAVLFVGFSNAKPEDAKKVIRQAIEHGKKSDFSLDVRGDGTTLEIEASFSYSIETLKLNTKGGHNE